MSTRRDRLPSTGFLLWGLLPAVTAISALSREPMGAWSNAAGAYALAWWIVAGQLRRSPSPTLAPALLLIALPWAAALTQSVRRVAFVMREGGMDKADGTGGSPMAFLLGVIFEVGFVFIPLTIIALRLWRAGRRSVRLQ
jgi:hypothetical protein